MYIEHGNLIYLDLHGSLWRSDSPDDLVNNSDLTREMRESLDGPISQAVLYSVISPMNTTIVDSPADQWSKIRIRTREELSLPHDDIRPREEITPAQYAEFEQTRITPYRLEEQDKEAMGELYRQNSELVICSASLSKFESVLTRRMIKDDVWRNLARIYFVPGFLRINLTDAPLFTKLSAYRLGSIVAKKENRRFIVFENEVMLAEVGTAFFDNVEFHLPITENEAKTQEHASSQFMPRNPDSSRIVFESSLEKIAQENSVSDINSTTIEAPTIPLSYSQNPELSGVIF